jgi:glycosyltransferase involved in cell wall biosynthesis
VPAIGYPRLRPGITVCVPSIPVRGHYLGRALTSIAGQLRPADAISVAVDRERNGAAVTRSRALAAVRTDVVTFLDDDDTMNPDHLLRLESFMIDTGADFVFSWFDVIGGRDPFPQHFGKVWNPDDPTHTTVVTMVRTELARSVGFVAPENGDGAGGSGEDWSFTLGCLAAGAKIMHLPERTWKWYHNTGNTSGRNDRW